MLFPPHPSYRLDCRVTICSKGQSSQYWLVLELGGGKEDKDPDF
jgi:hypothetical protein